MWTGVDLANGLDLTGFALAIAIGGVILAAYTGALWAISAVTPACPLTCCPAAPLV